MDIRSTGMTPGVNTGIDIQKTTNNGGKSGGEVSPVNPVQAPQDQLEISEEALYLQSMMEGEMGNVDLERAEKLARLKSEIDQGIYDIEGKLEPALSKLLDDISPNNS